MVRRNVPNYYITNEENRNVKNKDPWLINVIWALDISGEMRSSNKHIEQYHTESSIF